MAYHFYLATEGTKQGQFKGGSPRKGWKDGSEIHSFAFGVEVPTDIQQGTASGKGQQPPIVIRKSVDGASPQLFQALCTNEVLNDVQIHYWQPEPSGKEVVGSTIHLTQRTVSGFTGYTPSSSPSPQPSGQGAKGNKPSGEKLAPTIKLTNATIVSIGPIAVPGVQGPCERVELSPERIEKIMSFAR